MGGSRGKTSVSRSIPRLPNSSAVDTAHVSADTWTALRKAGPWEREDSAPPPCDWRAKKRAETKSARYKYS